MKQPITEMIGCRFGRLVVLSVSSGGSVECQCDCGVTHTAKSWHIRGGKTTSCGCYRREATAIHRKFHGEARITTEYATWSHLKGRCLNPKNSHFHRYGGRGITVCDRWLESYSNFLEDMGRRPSPGHSLDRENNDLGYCKENCRWADIDTQSNNKATAVEFNGKRQSLEKWGREIGISGSTLIRRIKRGWSIEKTLSTPKQPIGSNQYGLAG